MLAPSFSLEDIARNIEVNLPSFYISHKKTGACESCNALTSQAEKLPNEFRTAYFKHVLVEVIYNLYFKGCRYHSPLESTTEIDWDFYEKIDAKNLGNGWLHPSFCVTEEKDDNTLIAEFDNGILEVKKDVDLPMDYRAAKVGDPIAIHLPNSFVDQDMYVAHGNYLGGHPPSKNSEYVIILTFNFSADSALSAMELITRKLNEHKIAFRFSTLLNPLKYNLFNSGTIKVFCETYTPELYENYLFSIVKTIYDNHKSSFREEVPIFTKKLAPGIGLFERQLLRLGLHQLLDSEGSYCEYVANGLIDASLSGDSSLQNKMRCILSYFEKHGVDANKPYINPGFPDIYTPIV